MGIRELGRQLKNGNIPLVSRTIKTIQHVVNEPYESYWSYVDSRARRKSSDARIFKMLNKSYKDVIYSDAWEKKLDELLSPSMQKKKLDDDRIPVFSLWLQGIENAPEIVQICHRSMERYFDSARYNLISLNEKTVFDYIELPPMLQNMWKNFSAAHKSDIIRLLLLYQYGGDGSMLPSIL